MGHFKKTYLKYYRESLDDEESSNNNQQDFLLRYNGDGSQRPSQGKGTHVPHEDLSGVGIKPEKSESGTGQRAAHDCQFAAAGHIVDLEILCQFDMPGDISKNHIRGCGNNDRPDGEAIQSIREVNGIGRSYDHQDSKCDITRTQVRGYVFEKRNGHPGVEVRVQIEQQADNNRQDCLGGKLGFGR